MDAKSKPLITVLGVGNILFSDEGFGVRVIEALEALYKFPEDVLLVDGGVLGTNLLGIISQPRHLIIVDVIRNGREPGTPYRLSGPEIPLRIRAKNSLHQIDLLEALTLCQALDHTPETVIIGVEPHDTQTLKVGLSPVLDACMEPTMARVIEELKRVGVLYSPKDTSSCA